MSTNHTIADIEYATVDSQRLCLDLHRPEGNGLVPCVAYFHGGGWARGSRKDGVAERLAPMVDAGLAVASIDYRLTGVATHPAQLEDARAAIRWLRGHADELGIRAQRLGAWGASAGGWIALMLAYLASDEAGSVQATAAWFPVTDLLSVAGQRAEAGLPLPPFLGGGPAPSMEPALLGLGSLDEDLGAARAASPIAHAPDASCPTLLLHGDADGLINARQSIALHEALLAAGRESQLLLVRGANHEDPQFHEPAVLGATAGFFRARL